MAEEIQKPPEEFNPAKFFQERNEREAAIRAGQKPAEPVKAEEAKPEPKPEEKAHSAKPTGDQRKLYRTLRENGELRARLDALERSMQQQTQPKPAEVTSDEPKREDFNTDRDWLDARAEWKGKQGAEKALSEREKEARVSAEVREMASNIQSQFERAKKDFSDFDELLKTSKASNVDIQSGMPAVFAAWANSEYAAECMYEWLKEPKQLSDLMAAYKESPDKSLRMFHRMEGRVAGAPVKKQDPKPEVVEKVEEKPKPKPLASFRAPVGEAPPAAPEPGTRAWMAMRNAEKRARGF